MRKERTKMNESKIKKQEKYNQENQELISIIVPVYNIMDCLPKCVESICRQTYSNLEILLVDDGSNDGTEKLVDELAVMDERIRVFHKPNGGSSSARNLGIRKAQGQYIGFVDSDDFIEPQMYEELMEVIHREKVRIAQISRDEIDEQGNRLPDVCTPPEEAYVCPAETFLRELLLHRGDCSYCTKLTDRKLFDKYHFPEGVLNEDFHLLVEMLGEIDGIAVLPQQYYHVFYRTGSNTRKKSKEEFSRVFVDIVDNADMVEWMVKERYPVLQEEAVRFGLYQRLDYMLHIPVGKMVSEDRFYVSVKKYLRRHVADTIRNKYLSRRNKIYLLLLTVSPKTVRRIHGWKMQYRERMGRSEGKR